MKAGPVSVSAIPAEKTRLAVPRLLNDSGSWLVVVAEDQIGYEVARRIRRDPVLGGVRLVALSGYGQASDREQARKAGFDDHLIKPVQPRALFDAIAAARSERRG